ncbi:hypothetical protein LOK49_LG07G02551, partial [Camellia lanceoleosa]
GFAVPKEAQDKVAKFSLHGQPAELRHGSVVIAAITICTNTSNPSVMLGAGLVVKKGFDPKFSTCGCLFFVQMIDPKINASYSNFVVKPWVKTSLAPGSGIVTKYLLKSGLQKYFNEQGFHVVGYGCTTCIGNSGDLDESVASAISENDIVAAAVLSANRNFEGRVHALTRANYLASPPLVVAYALAGTVDIDFDKEPIGVGSSRDWAAKGPILLGVKAVIAKSFERIHRSNLVGMGIIPLCFKAGEDADSLGLTGHERYTIDLASKISEIKPGQDVTVKTDTGKSFTCTARFDIEVELAYFNHGGILPYIIRQLAKQ